MGETNGISTCEYEFKTDENETTLLTFTCSKSTIKTLENGVKYIQS